MILSAMRAERNLSQREVASMLDTNQPMVSRIESGSVSSHEMVERYVSFLGKELVSRAYRIYCQRRRKESWARVSNHDLARIAVRKVIK